jgi:Ca2+/H+ antiporter
MADLGDVGRGSIRTGQSARTGETEPEPWYIVRMEDAVPAWQAFLRQPLNWLLLAAPTAAALDSAGSPAPLVFLMAGLALVPLATLIVHSTEAIAARTGPAIGGLLNATFGNLPELIIAMVGVCIVLLALYVLYLVFMLRTHPDFFAVAKGADEEHGPRWSMARAGGTLVAASVGAAWMSEVLVGAAEETGHALGMSAAFIGIVLLAILGGAAESGAAIAMARKNKMDLSVGIAMGSSIQIALFVTPVLVLSSRFVAPERLTLSFTRVEVGALFLGVLIGVTLAGDGRANWFKGAQLVGFYLILAALFYLLPEVAA